MRDFVVPYDIVLSHVSNKALKCFVQDRWHGKLDACINEMNAGDW